MANEQNNSSEANIVRTLAVFGMVTVVIALIALAALLGAMWYASNNPRVVPNPPAPAPVNPYNPFNPLPHPQPQPLDTWHRPYTSVLARLPSPAQINDGFPRQGQYWRWEVNQRGEYRFIRVIGEPDELGELPKNLDALPPPKKDK